MAANGSSEQTSRMRRSLDKVSGWIHDNILASGSPDFTSRPVSVAPPEDDGEKAVKRAERLDTVKDLGEVVIHSLEKPTEAGQELNRVAIGQVLGTPGLIIDDAQHDPHQIAGDIGWGFFGIVRKIILTVTARVIAAPGRDEEPGKKR